MNIWFAWYPVKTEKSSWAWCQKLSREWSWEINSWCDGSGHSGYDGGWIYNKIESC